MLKRSSTGSGIYRISELTCGYPNMWLRAAKLHNPGMTPGTVVIQLFSYHTYKTYHGSDCGSAPSVPGLDHRWHRSNVRGHPGSSPGKLTQLLLYDSRLSFLRALLYGHTPVSDYAVLFHRYNKPSPTPYINRSTQTCVTRRPSLVFHHFALPQWTAFSPLIPPKPRLTPSSRSSRY